MILSDAVAIGGLLFFGTGCSLLAKMIYYVHGDNLYGKRAEFTKPWFQVLTMFVGMSLCVLLDDVNSKTQKNSSSQYSHCETSCQRHLRDDAQDATTNADERTPLLAANGHPKTTIINNHEGVFSKVPSLWLMQLPTLLDMLATACGTTGLLFTTVSVYQMLRGGQLVFVALLSITFLRRELNLLNYVGITLCVGGIVLVGLANVFSEPETVNKSRTLFGVLIILLGQFLQGAQSVVEEHYMQNLHMSSVKLVAWEGLFGVIHCVVWALPLVYLIPGNDHGHLEDSLDSLYMITHSMGIVVIMFMDMTMMLFYNLCGMIVTESLSAIHRVVIETLRTVCVWIIDLLMYYFVTNGTFGEPWTPYSWLQLVGFGFLVCGTLTYNAEQILNEYQPAEKIPKKKPSADAESSPRDIREAERGLKDGDKTTACSTDSKEDQYERNQGYDEELLDGADEDHFSQDGETETESERSSSFYGHPFGSASHGSFLLSSTPTAVASSPFLRYQDSVAPSVP